MARGGRGSLSWPCPRLDPGPGPPAPYWGAGMRHRYFYLDPELIKSLLAGLDLLRLFNQLLLAAGGEVETAKDWMRDLQQRGYIDEKVDLEAFFAKLEEEGLLGRDAQGGLQLTASGQRRMRKDAFEEVFANLKKAGPGYHPIPASGEGVERQPETKPYSFGDEIHSIDAIRSTQNALKRTVGELRSRRGGPRGGRDRAPHILRDDRRDRHLPLDGALRRGPHHPGQDRRARPHRADHLQVPEGLRRRDRVRRPGASGSSSPASRRSRPGRSTPTPARRCRSRARCWRSASTPTSRSSS